MLRTPGFAGWQQERWLFHCGDAAEYRGRAGWADIEEYPEAVESVLADGWTRDVLQYVSKDGDLTGYLFRCRHCGVRVAYADASLLGALCAAIASVHVSARSA
jgi:uncharacterized protein CbrC (UPF0167 family)